MKELAYDREQVEREVAIARMEAEHDALPQSLAESLEINKALRTQLGKLALSFEHVNSAKERRKERAIGFVLGILASLVAAGLWLIATVVWPALRT